MDAGFHDVAVGGLGGPLGLCSGLAGNATVGLEAIEMEKKKEGLRLRLKKTPPRRRRRCRISNRQNQRNPSTRSGCAGVRRRGDGTRRILCRNGDRVRASSPPRGRPLDVITSVTTLLA